MFGIRPLLLGMVVGSGGMFFAHRYHVVQTADGVIVVSRTQQVDLSSAYVDTRGWDTARWTESPDLALAMTNGGYGEKMLQSASGAMLDQAAAKLGLAQSEANWSAANGQPASQAMPEIVFRNGNTATTSASQAGGKEESLLDRLSRQFGSNPQPAAAPAPVTPVQVPAPDPQTPQYRSLTPVYPTANPHSAAVNERTDVATPEEIAGVEKMAADSLSETATRIREIARQQVLTAIPEDRSRNIVISMPIVSENSPAISQDGSGAVETPKPAVAATVAVPDLTKPPADVPKAVETILKETLTAAPRTVSDAYLGRSLEGISPDLSSRLPAEIGETFRTLSTAGPSTMRDGELKSY